MRVRNLQPEPTSHGVNVTPLIDVVMCLIIFFLIVGKLAADDRARVNLPVSSIGRGDRDPAALVLTITPDATSNLRWGGVQARVLVGGQEAGDPREIEAILRDRAEMNLAAIGLPGNDLSRTPVVIRADRGVPFAAVEPVLAACSALGITKVDYATERVP